MYKTLIKKSLSIITILLISINLSAQKDSSCYRKFHIELNFPEYEIRTISPNVHYQLKKWLAPFVGFRAMYDDYWKYSVKTGTKFYPYGERRRIVFSHHIYYRHLWVDGRRTANNGIYDINYNYGDILAGTCIEVKITKNLFIGLSADLGYNIKNGTESSGGLAGDLYYNIRYKLF